MDRANYIYDKRNNGCTYKDIATELKVSVVTIREIYLNYSSKLNRMSDPFYDICYRNIRVYNVFKNLDIHDESSIIQYLNNKPSRPKGLNICMYNRLIYDYTGVNISKEDTKPDRFLAYIINGKTIQEHIITDYLNGISVKDIAIKYNKALSTVYRVVKSN